MKERMVLLKIISPALYPQAQVIAGMCYFENYLSSSFP
jgi:hypothetical protein